MIYVPPKFAASAMPNYRLEMELIVCITEGIPVLDMIEIKKLSTSKSRLLISQEL